MYKNSVEEEETLKKRLRSCSLVEFEYEISTSYLK